jgi:hypothetical protein
VRQQPAGKDVSTEAEESIAWSHYSATTSGVIEDFMCAVVTMIFSMYILAGLLQLLLVAS